MSHADDTDPTDPTKPGFVGVAAKAFVGGIVTFAATAGTGIGVALGDGSLTQGELLSSVGAGLVLGFAAFGAVFGVKNAN